MAGQVGDKIENFELKGAGGGLQEFFSEIDFLVVSDRGDWYLSDAFGPMKKYCS